jgi:RNA-directed DNA polymerase
MRVPYGEGAANHAGSESCAGAREGAGEALTGGRAGRVLSREIDTAPGCRRRIGRRKATSDAPPARGVSGPRAVEDPVHARTHRVREPGGPVIVCGARIPQTAPGSPRM